MNKKQIQASLLFTLNFLKMRKEFDFSPEESLSSNFWFYFLEDNLFKQPWSAKLLFHN
jgi:hypothetical protein